MQNSLPGRTVELTLFSDMIVAILHKEAQGMRKGFRYLVVRAAQGLLLPEDFPAALELCRALSDDVAPMSADMCEVLCLPGGTTYARGADAWASGGKIAALENAHYFR